MKHLVYILFLFAAVACSTTPSSSGLKTITLREVQSKPAAEVLQQEELNASVKMIPLETNDSCLLGAVEQLVDAVCLQGGFHFVQGGIGAARLIRAAINQQYLHTFRIYAPVQPLACSRPSC